MAWPAWVVWCAPSMDGVERQAARMTKAAQAARMTKAGLVVVDRWAETGRRSIRRRWPAPVVDAHRRDMVSMA